jgi:hypothetical protein
VLPCRGHAVSSMAGGVKRHCRSGAHVGDGKANGYVKTMVKSVGSDVASDLEGDTTGLSVEQEWRSRPAV